MIDQYDILRDPDLNIEEYMATSPKYLYDVVVNYIQKNKIRMWNGIPDYDEVKYKDASFYHYYSNIIESAFKDANVPNFIINQVDLLLMNHTRVGWLRKWLESEKGYKDASNEHFILTIGAIKKVIDNLELVRK